MCGAKASRPGLGEIDIWVCPIGHGVAVPVPGAESAALTSLLERAEAAAAGTRCCPRCEGEMAVVLVEGDPPVKADVCAMCEVLWFDGLEIAGLPAGQSGPEQLAETALAHPVIAALLRSDQMQPAL